MEKFENMWKYFWSEIPLEIQSYQVVVTIPACVIGEHNRNTNAPNETFLFKPQKLLALF